MTLRVLRGAGRAEAEPARRRSPRPSTSRPRRRESPSPKTLTVGDLIAAVERTGYTAALPTPRDAEQEADAAEQVAS